MKLIVKKLLQRFAVYEYIRYSYLFNVYAAIFKPYVKQEKQREITFYQSFLTPCDLIFDIGANDGHKTEAFLHFAQKVVCCEPDNQNYKTLNIRFRNLKQRVTIEQVALGAHEGVTSMFIHHQGSAFNTLNEKFRRVTEADDLYKWNEKIKYQQIKEVRLTTLSALMKKYGRPHFIKIDVEGYELEVIKGLYQPIPFMSLECLLPDFGEELKENLRLLKSISENVEFNIAVHEQLLFPNFKSYDEILNVLQDFDKHHFELITRTPS